MKVQVPLFESRRRMDPELQGAAETTYEFLQRVDDPVFERVRDVFNSWLERFAALQTDEATNDLLGRFRSKQDLQFYATFWELHLREIHVRLGFEVEVHPQSSRGTRPGFVLSRGDDRFSPY